MKSIIILLLGIAMGSPVPDVWVYDMMPSDNVNSTEKLGICYGSSTSWNSYPYLAALRSGSGSACCSASIIQTSPVGILVSAAHCNGCNGQVRIGCSNPSTCTGADSISIANGGFTQHPNYNPSTISSDIAVVRLNGAITRSGAQTISIAQVEPNQGATRVTGYGITQTGNIPSSLQTMQSNKIERTQCDNIMRAVGITNIDNTMVCIRGGGAGQDNQPTMCSGDSGGPMASGNQLYGVNSWVLQGSGAGCNGCNCCSGYPQVGANAALFRGWILNQVSQINEEYYQSLNKTESV